MSSLWQKYRAIPPSTRIALGMGVIAYALVAQNLSDRAEEPLGLKATEEDKDRFWAGMPKIRVVDRVEDGRPAGLDDGKER